MPYQLEVQTFVGCEMEERKMNGKFEHVGYMRSVFTTKRKAESYYNMHNPHMRPLNSHKTWVSDWDPQTKYRYVVRDYNCEHQSIAPFTE
jgi:hypothetical protein